MKPEVNVVLSLFAKVTKAIKRAVSLMMHVPDEVLLEILIQKNRMPITKEDEELIEDAKQQARDRVVRGAHHTFSYILGEDGVKYSGLQETYRREADTETCAEPGAIQNLDIARVKPKTVVTVHFLPMEVREGRGVTTIVPPCLRCAARFRHLSVRHDNHNFGIIVYHRQELIKVSVRIAHLFQYPSGYNGDGTATY